MNAKRAMKFCAAWALYGLGHVVSIAADRMYRLYEWCMLKSDQLDEGWVWKEDWK